MPRIVTMIASATEIVCALGLESDLVARSHECDYPASVKQLPVCTAPRFAVDGSSLEIDQRVKSLLEQASSIYRVDAEMLLNLRAEVIVTQSQCEVCAVSEKDVQLAMESLLPSPPRGRGVGGEGAEFAGITSSLPPAPLLLEGDGTNGPKIISLSPNNLADVWQSIRNVADALGVSSRGAKLISELTMRVEAIAAKAASASVRPTVACLEWIDPLMAAGNWVPELVELAGGHNLFGSAGKHSPWMTWDELIERNPDVIVAMPCGFDLAKTRTEMATLARHPAWSKLHAVCDGRIFVTDGNQFFNRPGPRLVESLEILAEILYPQRFSFDHEGTGWQKYDAFV